MVNGIAAEGYAIKTYNVSTTQNKKHLLVSSILALLFVRL
jgi:hypothetical protein